MRTSLRTAFLLSVFTVLFALAPAASAQPTGYSTGVYRVVDRPNEDAGVLLAADFAVKEQASRAKTTITLKTVVKASDKEPMLGARDFMLCLDTNVTGKQTYAQAIVTMDQYSNLKLMGWSKSTCGKAASGGTATGGAASGSYAPLKSDHAGANLAADFAVKEKAAALKSPVKLVSLVKAEMAEGAKIGYGTFRLCLVVAGNGVGPGAQTLVSMDQYNNLKLISWTDSNCPETDGEFMPVEKGFTAGVDMAADWAVGKHSKDTKIEHKLIEILKREEKGMFGVTYRICMKVGEGSETQVIQAIVTRDQYSNHKLVSWEHSTCTK